MPNIKFAVTHHGKSIEWKIARNSVEFVARSLNVRTKIMTALSMLNTASVTVIRKI